MFRIDVLVTYLRDELADVDDVRGELVNTHLNDIIMLFETGAMMFTSFPTVHFGSIRYI